MRGVTDRRLLKAAALMRISACTCGRDCVTAADALLLEFVFAHTPLEGEAIREFVVTWIKKRNILPSQFRALVAGLAKRACAADASSRARTSLAAEAASMQQAHGMLLARCVCNCCC
jgi:hypothetical protein